MPRPFGSLADFLAEKVNSKMGGFGSGRRPLPVACRIADGTHRPDRQKLDMASIDGLGEPAKPRGLEKYASQMWDQIIKCHKSKGTLAAIDAAFIQSACEVWGLYRKAYKDAKACPCDKNICNAVKSYLGMWEAMARRLGMNPVDRVKIHPNVPTGKPSVASRKRA